jgi:hypothetical protein
MNDSNKKLGMVVSWKISMIIKSYFSEGFKTNSNRQL